MFGRTPLWRHLVLAVVVVVLAGLGFAGVIGAGSFPERFEAKTVFVQPAGEDGVRITEVVDEDFGSQDRHGYQRIIPNDFGVPTDIEASSPDANADVHVLPGFANTTIRLGDPDATIDGQHRYVLSYTLPDAQLSNGRLALDIIGTEETLATDEFNVVVVGMQLDQPTCNAGRFGAVGGCDLVADGDTLRATIAPLQPGQGITIGGTVVSTDPDAPLPAFPPQPVRRPNHQAVVGVILLVGCSVVAVVAFVVIRRRGRNEVAAGGAADAAYATDVPGSVRLVPDDRMAALATTEFVPPKGIQPWQGSVLLREQIGSDTVSAWFSGLIAQEVLAIDDTHRPATLSVGPKFGTADRDTQALLAPAVGSAPVKLGTYDPTFAKLWRSIQLQQVGQIGASGWWRSMPPGTSAGGGVTGVARLAAVAVVFVVFAGGGIVRSGVLDRAPVAIAAALLVTAALAGALYWYMLRSRSAVGSGLAIRTESFRRFLAASEGQHVDWAWQHGVLREYSAWAVALGAADAWRRALAASHVPPNEVHLSNPLLVYALASTFSQTMTAPQSSSSGGGGFSGGFSGGSVGGGGGGGSSGSW